MTYIVVHYFLCVCLCFFFFKQKTAYEMRISDWSSDVCSSDLELIPSGRWPAGRYLLDDVGDIGLRLNPIELGGLDDGVDSGGAFAAGLRSGEQPVLAADGDRSDRALGDIIVDLRSSFVEIAGDRKSTRLNASPHAQLVCRLLPEKKKQIDD